MSVKNSLFKQNSITSTAHSALDTAHPDMALGSISGYIDEIQNKTNKLQARKTNMVIIILVLSYFDFF